MCVCFPIAGYWQCRYPQSYADTSWFGQQWENIESITISPLSHVDGQAAPGLVTVDRTFTVTDEETFRSLWTAFHDARLDSEDGWFFHVGGTPLFRVTFAFSSGDRVAFSASLESRKRSVAFVQMSDPNATVKVGSDVPGSRYHYSPTAYGLLLRLFEEHSVEWCPAHGPAAQQ